MKVETEIKQKVNRVTQNRKSINIFFNFIKTFFIKTFKLILGFSLLTVIIYSCTKNEKDDTMDNKSEVLYERSKVSANENYTHYKNIQLIEKISANNNDFKKALKKVPNLKISTTNDILKYTYDGNIISYKIGQMYIYTHNNNVLPIKTTETSNSKKQKVITISNALNNELFYSMNLDINNSKIISFEKINHFPLEKLGFVKDSDNVLNKAAEVECDDLSWADCMDCTVEDCGRHWWCVAMLVVAGPETLAGMAVSCTVDQ